ncbi:MAG: EamA family transporter [Limimaricola sp.]|uniref:DMT family transporter n=1 Tax=Limimaricola sp. TaxID=2211665 RepID=UPI001DCDA83A|nr:DMT family transporter [Limimaricola sp.]MBI1416331.1 EamA family transporter [Limimaricola sp.]
MRGAFSARAGLSAVLLFCGVSWGLTVPLGKVATGTGWAPLTLVFWELAISSVVLGLIVLVRRDRPLLTRDALIFYVVVAFLGTLIPSFTFYTSVRHLPSGIVAILISTVPMVSFPLAMALGTDQVAPRRLMGLGLGLAGVVLIAAPGVSLPDPAMLVFLPVALIGPLSYALEGNFVAFRGTGQAPVAAMFGVSVMGTLLCLPAILATGQWAVPVMPPGRPEAALIAGAVIHGVVYSVYIWLVGRAGPIFAGLIAYLVTGFGVVWSMLLLGEHYSWAVWLALALMLSGIALVQPRKREEAPADAALPIGKGPA